MLALGYLARRAGCICSRTGARGRLPRSWCALLAAIAAILAAPWAPASAQGDARIHLPYVVRGAHLRPSMALRADAGRVVAGDVFETTVWVAGFEPLAGATQQIQADIHFDPERVAPLGRVGAPGDVAIIAPSAGGFALWGETRAGCWFGCQVAVSVLAFPNAADSAWPAEALLATLRWRALRDGSAAFVPRGWSYAFDDTTGLQRYETLRGPALDIAVAARTTGPDGCASVGGRFDALPIRGRPTDRPAGEHPDINLELRGYRWEGIFQGLVDYDGEHDPRAPKLGGLLGGAAVVGMANYRAHDWDWSVDARGAPLTTWPATLLEVATTPGQAVHVPASGYDIGSGFEVLVLYAAEDRATLKYTREDNVVFGYTLHVEGVCVDRALLARYRALDQAGRGRLPALKASQAFGRAVAVGVGVAVRDAGSFMDPRSRKDWW